MNITITVHHYTSDSITLTARNDNSAVTFTYTRGEEDADGSNFTGWYWDGDDLMQYEWKDTIVNIINAHPHNATAQKLKTMWDETDWTGYDQLNTDWEQWAINELQNRISRTIGYITNYTLQK